VWFVSSLITGRRWFDASSSPSAKTSYADILSRCWSALKSPGWIRPFLWARLFTSAARGESEVLRHPEAQGWLILRCGGHTEGLPRAGLTRFLQSRVVGLEDGSWSARTDPRTPVAAATPRSSRASPLPSGPCHGEAVARRSVRLPNEVLGVHGNAPPAMPPSTSTGVITFLVGSCRSIDDIAHPDAG
jgi:hypothetical protein